MALRVAPNLSLAVIPKNLHRSRAVERAGLPWWLDRRRIYVMVVPNQPRRRASLFHGYGRGFAVKIRDPTGMLIMTPWDFGILNLAIKVMLLPMARLLRISVDTAVSL